MSITILLILITVGMSLYAWQNEGVLRRWMLNPYAISHGREYWRFLTSGFIHADWGHLIFNMLSFYFFGPILEQIMGPASLALLYILGIIISDLPTYFRHKDDSHYNSLGASGGVAAVIFAGIIFFPLNKIFLFFIPIGIPGFVFGALYLLYSYYEARKGAGYVNHSAHLWGAMFGILFVVLLFPEAIPSFIEQITSYRFF